MSPTRESAPDSSPPPPSNNDRSTLVPARANTARRDTFTAYGTLIFRQVQHEYQHYFSSEEEEDDDDDNSDQGYDDESLPNYERVIRWQRTVQPPPYSTLDELHDLEAANRARGNHRLLIGQLICALAWLLAIVGLLGAAAFLFMGRR